ncbi:asparagine synthase (glutamine-hydrolyzing) [Alicyclobacillus tolerans]|uniref:asparagine synthase (glutamine-hydrolyzing) n=1 Tax=Alicyclobacillus tolerans TaxID=90970 RepID=UPI003B7FA4DD
MYGLAVGSGSGASSMCGICGTVERSGKHAQQDMLLAMTRSMVHRGPDEEGIYLDKEAGLGFRRLSIVDLAHGHQPMTNEDQSVWVVFNGEIYNHKNLRKDLIHRGHQLKTESDTEVLVHLYEEHGVEMVHLLRGMFAFAIWDVRKREMVLARDRFGIKPLYYTHSPNGLLFASEMRSLLASGQINRQLNHQALWDYLTFQYVPDPQTILADVQKLPPGHYLRYRQGNIDMTRYFTPRFLEREDWTESEHVDRVRQSLEDSVRLHLQADVPYGAFLSSGVDSSSIVALMKKYDTEVKTFSVGFNDASGWYNELASARDTARALGTEHREISVSAAQFAERLPEILQALDEPIADVSACALYFVAELAAEDVKVVLSGEGADELFAGYPIYHEPRSLKMFSQFPSWVLRAIGGVAGRLPAGLKGRGFLERGSLPLERRFVGNAKIFSEEAKSMLMEQFFRTHSSFHVTDPVYQAFADLPEITRMQLIDMHTWLPGDILMKADKMTMAHSIELRVPFLDNRVLEAASAIPESMRIQGRTTKAILRKAVRDLLPENVVSRPKLGFPVPVSTWLAGSMGEMALEWIVESPLMDWLSKNEVESLFRRHQEGERHLWRELWTLVTMAAWLNHFLQPKSVSSDYSMVGAQQSLTVGW